MLKNTVVVVSCISILAFGIYYSGLYTSDTQQQASVAQTSGIRFKDSAVTVQEGRNATIILVAPATLSRTTRITYQVLPQTAKSQSDFTIPTNRTVTFFKGGLKEKRIVIRTKADQVNEGAETFAVRATGVTGSVVVTIAASGGTVGTTTTPKPTNAAGKNPWYTCPAEEMAKVNGFPLRLRNNIVQGPSTFGITPPDAPIVYTKNGSTYLMGFSFPGLHSSARVGFPQNVGEYTSVRLPVPEDVPVGITKEWINAVTTNTAGFILWSISECQGDFRPVILNKKFLQYPDRPMNTPGIENRERDIVCSGMASTGGNAVNPKTFATYPTKYTEIGDLPICPMVSGRTYYYNITAGPVSRTANGFNPETGVTTQNDIGPVSSREEFDRYISHPDHALRGGGGFGSPYVIGNNFLQAFIDIHHTAGSIKSWFDDAQSCIIRNSGQVGNCLNTFPKRTERYID